MPLPEAHEHPAYITGLDREALHEIVERLIETLADIAWSDDMNEDTRRHKAACIYNKIADRLTKAHEENQ